MVGGMNKNYDAGMGGARWGRCVYAVVRDRVVLEKGREVTLILVVRFNEGSDSEFSIRKFFIEKAHFGGCGGRRDPKATAVPQSNR